MSNVSHASLTGSNLHEPKGADTATANTLYVANGSGSGTWQKITASQTTGVGAWQFITAKDASSSSTLDFVNGSSSVVLDSTYDAYCFELANIKPATDAVGLQVRFGTAGPSWLTTSNYSWFSSVGGPWIGGHSHNFASSVDSMTLGYGANVTYGIGSSSSKPGVNGQLCVYDPDNTALCPNARWDISWWPPNSAALAYGPLSTYGSGAYGVAGGFTAVRFYFSSGNIASGRIALLGLRKS